MSQKVSLMERLYQINITIYGNPDPSMDQFRIGGTLIWYQHKISKYIVYIHVPPCKLKKYRDIVYFLSPLQVFSLSTSKKFLKKLKIFGNESKKFDPMDDDHFRC